MPFYKFLIKYWLFGTYTVHIQIVRWPRFNCANSGEEKCSKSKYLRFTGRYEKWHRAEVIIILEVDISYLHVDMKVALLIRKYKYLFIQKMHVQIEKGFCASQIMFFFQWLARYGIRKTGIGGVNENLEVKQRRIVSKDAYNWQQIKSLDHLALK